MSKYKENRAPRFSILIPTYNQGGTIGQAVVSALSMDFDDFEVIVVDDASTEVGSVDAPATKAVLDSIRDARLTYVRNEKNIGRSATYREALSRAHGEWVMVCDGDDYYVDRDFLKKAASVISRQPNLVLVGMGDALAYADYLVPRPLAGEERLLDGKQVFLEWGHLAVPHLGAIYRRSLALDLNFYRCDILSTDWESLLRLVLQGDVALLPGICGHWRQHDHNASRSADWEDFQANLQSVELPAAEARRLKVFEETELQAWERDQVEEKILGYLTSLVLAGAEGSVGPAELKRRRKAAFALKRQWGIGVTGPSNYRLRWWVHEYLGTSAFVALYRAKHFCRRFVGKSSAAVSAVLRGRKPYRRDSCAE